MTLRELLEQKKGAIAEKQSNLYRTDFHDGRRFAANMAAKAGFNHALDLLWPCIKVLEEIAEGQAGTQSKGAQKAKSALEKLKNR